MTAPTPVAPSPLAASSLGQVALTVQDVDRATAFYRDTLGVPFLFAAPPGLAFFSLGSVRLMLSRAETPELARGNSVLYLRVDDIQRAHAALRERGVRFEDEPHLIARMPDHDLWMTFFHDVDGNMLALMSEVSRG